MESARDNEFILTGYRRASFSYYRSLQSILEVHNETVNIWTHLLGSAHFVLTLNSFLTLSSISRLQDIIAVALYQACVAASFLLSTIYHTFSDHSAEVSRIGNQLDHLGIVLVISGTGISGVHFTFPCKEESRIRNTYFVLLTTVAGVCAVFTLQPNFRTTAYRPFRAVLYFLFGVCVLYPVVHGVVRRGRAPVDDMMDLASFLGVGAVVTTGGIVYAARIPERWFPGTFDMIGKSHNWMHVIVYAGALVRLAGLLRVVEKWQGDLMELQHCQGL